VISKNVSYILLNSSKQIQDLSPTCIQMLGITYEKLNKKQIYFDMPSLFPQMFQDNLNSYTNKAGSLITYHIPYIVEMDSKSM